ncbi:unnamed protein product, partial [Porites evermanni]
CTPKTTTGQYCSIPFVYNNVTYYGCTDVDHDQPWCSLTPQYSDGQWGNCDCTPKATTGQYCSIPFVYNSVTYYGCTDVDHNQPWCFLTPQYSDGQWGNCVSRVDWLGRPANIKVENNGAVVYVGSSLTVHNPLFFVHNLVIQDRAFELQEHTQECNLCGPDSDQCCVELACLPYFLFI